VIVPDIDRFGEKDKATGQQNWEDLPAGSALEGLLLPRPPGKDCRLLKVVSSFPNSIWERPCGRNSISQLAHPPASLFPSASSVEGVTAGRRTVRPPADTPAWEIEFPAQGRSQMEFGNESGERCRPLAAEPCPRAACGRNSPATHGSRGVLRPISDPSRRPGQGGKPAAGASGEWVKALSQKLESARGAGAGPEV